MNNKLLNKDVQAYINVNLDKDSTQIALAKSPFEEVSAAELAQQISSKQKTAKKLPTWYHTQAIVFPVGLSIEQSSSEETAKYKSHLAIGNLLIDLTAGFGVDSYYFSKKVRQVYSCEIDKELVTIATHNANLLKADNIKLVHQDGLDYLKNSPLLFDTIYIDPARRKNSSKVFKLADCTPNIVENLDFLISKARRIIIKTSPLLDIQAGLKELYQVSEIHIISIKNECKELLWIIEAGFDGVPKIIVTTINEQNKQIELPLIDDLDGNFAHSFAEATYLYEPDVALMKSGAFNRIGNHFKLQKLDKSSHFYFSSSINKGFMGRIFRIKRILTSTELKKKPVIKANVISRNYPEKAVQIIKKYKIKPSNTDFLIFTKVENQNRIIEAEIIQYY